jgi:predicted acylesterase/phospholipase RssA
MDNTEPKPFENIGIALSGGGYRAAAFHLGTLSYLDALELQGLSVLSNLKMLSTISGGSITGVFYAYKCAKGKPFSEFFSELYQFLKRDELLKESSRHLNTEENLIMYGHKAKNIINTFSILYDLQLFEKATFSVISKYSKETGKHFMFNATDIESAIPFRFQTRGYFGHGIYKVSSPDYATIKLSDIVAASSCFPLAFEPMVFPNDFLVEKSPRIEKDYPSIRLMDGGIVDNQGTESLLLGDRNTKTKMGSFIISDVAQKIKVDDDPDNSDENNPSLIGEIPQEDIGNDNTPKGLFAWSVGSIKKALGLVFIVCFIALFLSVKTLWAYSLMLVLGTIAFVLYGLIYRIERLVVSHIKNLKMVKETPSFLEFLPLLDNINMGYLRDAISNRISSFVQINLNVFLTRMRTVNNRQILGDEKHKFRTVANNIYSLTNVEDKPKEEIIEGTNYTGSLLESIVIDANKMGTTLWFSNTEKENNKMLHALIITGQATICYNLLGYIQKFKDNTKYTTLLPEYQSDLLEIEQKLITDFEQFKKNPHWLLDKKGV